MLPTLPLSEITIIHQFMPRIYMNDGEMDVLVALFLSVKPETVIEFGVNFGLTAEVLLKHIPSIKQYIGIDVSPGYHTRIPEQQKEVPINPGILVQDDDRFKLMLRREGSFDIKPRDLPQAQAIFIDGDHSYDAVMHDSSLAFECIQDGGIIVWHDYGNPSVEVTFALEDLHVHDGHTIKNVEGTWLAVERF